MFSGCRDEKVLCLLGECMHLFEVSLVAIHFVLKKLVMRYENDSTGICLWGFSKID